jgi:hypothetical protein
LEVRMPPTLRTTEEAARKPWFTLR